MTHSLLPNHAGCAHSSDRAVGTVFDLMAGERAGVAAAIVRNGCTTYRCNYFQVETHQTLTGTISRRDLRAMRGVASGTTEARVQMRGVTFKAAILQDGREIVAFPTQGIRPLTAGIRAGVQVRNQIAGQHSLAELIAALQNM